MRAEILECNSCGSKMDLGKALGWIGTKPIGINAERFGDPPLDGDFCSPRCLVNHFLEFMPPRALLKIALAEDLKRGT